MGSDGYCRVDSEGELRVIVVPWSSHVKSCVMMPLNRKLLWPDSIQEFRTRALRLKTAADEDRVRDRTTPVQYVVITNRAPLDYSI
jgi:hypothetical protein